MSDSAGKRPAKTVSMDKKPTGAPTRPVAGKSGEKVSVPIPRTIQLACIAIAAEIVFTLIRGVSMRGYTSELTTWLIDSNHKAKKPVPDAKYLTQIPHDLSQLRNGILIQGVVVCVALAILGVSLRRPRGASGARWALLIIIVLTSGPLAVVPIAGFPAVPKYAGVLMGLSSIAVIVLILVPQSLRYFRDCKAATRPAGAVARPGLASMFGAKGAAGGRPGGLGALFAPRPPRTEPAATRPAAANLPPRPRSKAKVRAEADAVAKGADLARARARASKSRRTEVS